MMEIVLFEFLADWIVLFEDLSDEEAGKLIKALIDVKCGVESDLDDRLLNMALRVMLNDGE